MKIKLQASIIDDEPDGREYISLLLKKEFPEIEIAFEAPSVEAAYKMLIKHVPDILFLDIQLEDGDAFDLLSKFDSFDCQIIFITAFEQYAVKAIKNQAVDYLLKPIDEKEFIVAVKKALGNLKKNHLAGAYDAEPKINLPTLQGFKRVEIKNIIRCEADSNYTVFCLSDSSRVMVSKTLHTFEEYLLEHSFCRIHSKHLINLRHVSEYIKGRGGQVIMSDNSVLDVSERKKADFLLKL